MGEILKVLEMIIGVLLILVILIQPKRSSLNLVTFGNEGGKFERRGAEKTLHNATIGLGALFIVLSLVYFFAA